MNKEEEKKKLIKIENEDTILEFLEKIKAGETVLVSINQRGGEKMLTWNKKELFVFDVCLRGHQEYNAISVIRDMLKHHHPDGHWTRKKVETMVSFESIQLI